MPPGTAPDPSLAQGAGTNRRPWLGLHADAIAAPAPWPLRFWIQVLVRLTFSQVVRAQLSPAMRSVR